MGLYFFDEEWDMPESLTEPTLEEFAAFCRYQQAAKERPLTHFVGWYINRRHFYNGQRVEALRYIKKAMGLTPKRNGPRREAKWFFWIARGLMELPDGKA